MWVYCRSSLLGLFMASVDANVFAVKESGSGQGEEYGFCNFATGCEALFSSHEGSGSRGF